MSNDSGNAFCIAVISVHGVADQKPHETARAIADVLSRVEGRHGGRYQAFQENHVRVPVRRVARSRGETFAEIPDGQPVRPSLFDVRQAVEVQHLVDMSKGEYHEPQELADVLAHEYMKQQLSTYTPDVADYWDRMAPDAIGAVLDQIISQS